MLSTKSFRVALAAIGSALLLGSGFAAAQPTDQHLDGTAAKGNAPDAVTYAAELLTTEITGATLKAVPVNSPDATPAGTDADSVHRLVVTPRRVLDFGTGGTDVNALYLRLTLGNGMTLSEPLSDNGAWGQGTFHGKMLIGDAGEFVTQKFAGGEKGDDYAVYKATNEQDIPLNTSRDETALEMDLNGDEDMDDTEVPLRNSIFVNVADKLAVPAGNEGDYTATISAHRTVDDAIDNQAPSGTVAGSATIVKVEEGIAASVCAAGTTGCVAEENVIADVGSPEAPFLWFKDDSNDVTGVKPHAVLGAASARAKGEPGVLINPDNGSPVTNTDLIEEGSLTFTVEGDFSIGAFNLGGKDKCPAPGKADAPSKGNLMPDEDGPANEAMLGGQNAGTYYLCVQVDNDGPNDTPIPATKYMGEITLGTGATALKLADGTIGDIKRNGTTVKLTYLTISSKYNQRLIIVNDSASDATYSISGFSAEEGVMVEALDKASGTIPAGHTDVIKVAEIVDITHSTGDYKRTAATLSINADSDDIQVATTQVNLSDGSTDTVLYAAEGGVEVN